MARTCPRCGIGSGGTYETQAAEAPPIPFHSGPRTVDSSLNDNSELCESPIKARNRCLDDATPRHNWATTASRSLSCEFVAKIEVKHWPVFGWFGRLAGTAFVQRERRAQVARTVAELEIVLCTGTLMGLFPEGTSSGGDTVSPFESSLLEAATGHARPLTAGVIAYELDDGDVSEEVCYRITSSAMVARTGVEPVFRP